MSPEEHREVFRAGWNAALQEALMLVPGGDICKPQDVADAIRTLIAPAPSGTSECR